MTKSKEQIIEDIRAHIQKRGGGYDEWFIGTGDAARECLFKNHGVKEKGDRWILRRADSTRTAHDVVDYFVNILSMDYSQAADAAVAGTATATAAPADAVYAYRKAGHTRP